MAEHLLPTTTTAFLFMTRTADKRRILLITAPPGVGKTTLIRKLAAALPSYRIAGFYTAEIREGGQRRGFRLVSFRGQQCIIAHVAFNHQHRVSKYGVDVASIDRLADAALSSSQRVDVYLVDEIGKMECMSPRFVSRLTALLDSGRIVIATVASKGSGFIEDVKKRADCELWQLSYTNRNALVAQALEWLERR